MWSLQSDSETLSGSSTENPIQHKPLPEPKSAYGALEKSIEVACLGQEQHLHGAPRYAQRQVRQPPLPDVCRPLEDLIANAEQDVCARSAPRHCS